MGRPRGRVGLTLGLGLLACLSLATGSAPAAAATTPARLVPPCPGGCPPAAGAAWQPGALVRFPPDRSRFGCGQRTRGVRAKRSLDRALIRRVVRDHAGQVRWCYRKALLGLPDLAGELALTLTVGADGAVYHAAVESETLDAPAALRCVHEKVRTWRFPPVPGADPVTFRYPFRLVGVAPPRAPTGGSPAAPEECPVRSFEPAAAEAIARLEEEAARLPRDDPQRHALLLERAARLAGQAAEIETRSVDAFLPRMGDATRETGDAQRLAACDAAGREALGRALAVYEQVAREFPAAEDADTTLYLTALLTAELGRAEEADRRFAALVERFPTSKHAARAHFLLGELRVARSDCAGAAPHLEAAAAAEVGALAWTARHRLAWCRLRAGDFQEALTRLSALALELAAAADRVGGLLVDLEDDLLLAWSAAGSPAQAFPFLRKVDPGRAPRAAARLAALYDDHGEPEAAAKVYRTLLTSDAPAAARLAWWRDLVGVLSRAGQGSGALAELASGLDVLAESEPGPLERAAWVDLVVDLAERHLHEAAVTRAPDAVALGRRSCDLLGTHRGLSPRVAESWERCAAFLLDVAGDPEAAAALLDRQIAGSADPDVRARAALDRVAARRLLLGCNEDEAPLPGTDDLAPQPLTAAESAFVAAVDQAAAFVSAASAEFRGAARPAALVAARLLYDRNRFAEAVPRLAALLDERTDETARDAAPLLLSACRLGCDHDCLGRWTATLAGAESVMSDALRAQIVWWRTGGATQTRLRCE